MSRVSSVRLEAVCFKKAWAIIFKITAKKANNKAT